ncbi:hypothetical protein [Acinetobacter bereziniae]|uniref:hypothetical protein n=1 Tax=Acinetobacter bereziniae TaxID=106648 RepID=UPI000EF721B3|nr:hypothetical protein [Acinetobacter bereziniae]
MEIFDFKRMAQDAFISVRLNFDDLETTRNWVIANRLFRFGRTNSIKFCEVIGIDPEGTKMEAFNEIQQED